MLFVFDVFYTSAVVDNSAFVVSNASVVNNNGSRLNGNNAIVSSNDVIIHVNGLLVADNKAIADGNGGQLNGNRSVVDCNEPLAAGNSAFVVSNKKDAGYLIDGNDTSTCRHKQRTTGDKLLKHIKSLSIINVLLSLPTPKLNMKKNVLSYVVVYRKNYTGSTSTLCIYY